VAETFSFFANFPGRWNRTTNSRGSHSRLPGSHFAVLRPPLQHNSPPPPRRSERADITLLGRRGKTQGADDKNVISLEQRLKEKTADEAAYLAKMDAQSWCQSGPLSAALTAR
jgi:hypothetical protein